MLKLILITVIVSLNSLWACDSGPVDILLIGDSQTGASWSKSYFGNFVQECLNEKFIIFGKGGSNPIHWTHKGGLDQVEIIQRDEFNQQLNLGKDTQVPLCKKRLTPMIQSYQPRKVALFFGDNLIASSDTEIMNQTEVILSEIVQNKIIPQHCFFITPTYEMEVSTRRNVTRKNFETTLRISHAIKNTLKGRCTHIDGLKLMESSEYFIPKANLLKRAQIPGLIGCSGSANNDNIHICGEAARDMARRVCAILNEQI